MRFWKVFSFLLLLAPFSAMAQVGVYGEFSSTRITAANMPQMYGVTFGAYSDRHLFSHMPLLTLGPDARLTLQSGTSSSRSQGGGPPAQSIISAMVGPRLAFKLPFAGLHPYVEGLAGGGNSQIGEVYNDVYSAAHPGVFANGANKNGGASFEGQLVGGVDWTFKPHVDWRVVEFSYGRLLSVGTTHDYGLETLSTGIVVRLP